MNLLLDTHVWVWSQENVEALGQRTRRALVSRAHTNLVCAISALEIARLVAAGDISLCVSLSEWMQQSLLELGAESVPVTNDIAVEGYALPSPFHKDPADRILVAAARYHRLTLVTADERMLGYEHVRTLDARS